jgi:hypothetical protein
MSLQKATRAAVHVPANAQEMCTCLFFHLVHLMKHQDIPPELVTFMDQTGKYLMGKEKSMYEVRGSKQVSLAGKDKKQAYTLCTATTAAGNAIAFQQVWSGKTTKSLPSNQADGMAEALALGFHFAVAASPKVTSHFSTLKTMIDSSGKNHSK